MTGTPEIDAVQGEASVIFRGRTVHRWGRFTLPLLFAVLLPALAHAQSAERIDVVAVEMLVDVRDARGNVPDDVSADDFQVLEEGQRVRVLSVEPIIPQQTTVADSSSPADTSTAVPWHTVLYFDQTLSTRQTMQITAHGLASRAEELTELGWVEVVVSDGAPRRLLAPTRDPAAVRDALAQVRGLPGYDRLRALRADFASRYMARTAALARMTIAQEQQMIRAVGDAFRGFIGARTPARGGAVFLVSDGWDVDPLDFYAQYVGELSPDALDEGRDYIDNSGAGADDLESWTSVVNSMSGPTAGRRLVLEAAASGWVVFPLGGGVPWSSNRDASSLTGGLAPDHTGRGTPHLVAHPTDPLLELADATGGSYARHPRSMDAQVESMRERFVLTYQSSRPLDAQIRRVEVRPVHDDWRVRARQWVSDAPPESLSATRIRSLTLDDASSGTLPVRASIQPTDDGRHELTTTVGVTEILPLLRQRTRTQLRLSVRALDEEGRESVVHQEIELDDPAAEPTITHVAPLLLRDGTTSVSVLVEEYATGAWGGDVVTLQKGSTPAQGDFDAGARTSLLRDNLWRMTWLSAFREARERERLLAVLVTDETCPNCRKVVPEVAAHQRVRDVLEREYVPVWIDMDNPPPEILHQKPFWDRPPEMFLFDPWGGMIASARFDDIDRVLALLERTSKGRANFVAGARLLATEPDSHRGHELIGLALAETGVPAAARERWERARSLATAAGDEAAVFDLDLQIAMSLAWERHFSRALSHLDPLQQRAATDHERARIWFTRGRIHTLAGEQREAAGAFVQASRLGDPGSDMTKMASELAARGIGAVIDSAPASNAASPVRVILPAHRPLTGRTKIETVPLRPDIQTVEFRLGGQQIIDDRPPFARVIDLGVTRSQVLTVIARDMDGREVGRESILLNPASEGRLIRIASEPRGHGPVELDLEVTTPPGDRLASIDVFWNDELKMRADPTDRSPEIVLPDETGVVRVVARYSSGEHVEDARLWNSPGAVERVDVERIETFARVEDRSGHAIENLGRDEFRLLVDGVPHPIESVSWNAAVPASAGLVIDISDSMREQLPQVLDVARSFLDEVISGGGEAFTVAFADRPWLITPRTRERARLLADVEKLTVAGGTALWDAITFGLLQFQGRGGKRALLVLSDGADMNSRNDWREALRVAQETGVPVYILSIRQGFDAAFNPVSQSERNARADVERVARGSGGQAYWLSGTSRIAPVLSEVLDQTREQYTVVWEPPPDRTGLTPIELRVTRPGARLRSVTAVPFDRDE